MMRFLIMLEQTEAGFAVQVPDLAIVTYGENIEVAKQASVEAIQINLNRTTGHWHSHRPVLKHRAQRTKGTEAP